MFPVGDDGGEEELWHVRSGGCSVTHVPSGGWWRRGGSVSCTQCGGHSLTYVPSGGWRRGGALACTQWGTLSDTCPQWGMVEERRICVMYAVGDTHSHMFGIMEERRICAMDAVEDTHSHMFSVGDDVGEKELWHVPSGGHSVTHVPCWGWVRRGGPVSCTQ